MWTVAFALAQTYTWHMNTLKNIRTRRYRLRKSALEFFFMSGRSYFLEFPPRRWTTVYRAIHECRPKNCKTSRSVVCCCWCCLCLFFFTSEGGERAFERCRELTVSPLSSFFFFFCFAFAFVFGAGYPREGDAAASADPAMGAPRDLQL